MTPKFSQYLNKTILVSIPTLFHDGKCRSFKLLGVDPQGLWLQSDELAAQLLSEEHQYYASADPAVFVPFAYTAGILVATTVPAPAPAAAQPPTTQPTGGDNRSPDPKAGANNPASTVKGRPAEKPPLPDKSPARRR